MALVPIIYTFYENIKTPIEENIGQLEESFKKKDKRDTSFFGVSSTQFKQLNYGKFFQEGNFYPGEGIRIAVIDAGFKNMDNLQAFKHLFKEKRIVSSYDFVEREEEVFDDDVHGLAVISCLASRIPGLLMGTAPNADYILLRSENAVSEFLLEEYYWLQAAEYADSLGVDIINSSLGYYDFDDPAMNYTKQQLDGKTTYITRGANIASKKGILVVNSIGNYGPGSSSLLAPADASGILSVGSVTTTSTVSSFSSRGPTADGRIKPELSAFGQSPVLVRSNGTIGTGQGTSFSAPQLAALAAGLWEGRPEWTKDQLLLNLLRSATQYDKPDNNLGYGIPDFRKAYFGEILGTESEELIPLKLYPNPLQSDELSIWFGSAKNLDIQVLDISGRKIAEETLKRYSIKEPYWIKLNQLQPGLYILQLSDQKNTVQTKLIKK
jgi:subtilisin family serine protease